MNHITSLIRRAVRYRRDCAPLKLLTYVWTGPPKSRRRFKFRRPLGSPPRCTERSETARFPGCLTSESEERETWTAESLRTASSNGEDFGLYLRKGRSWK